MFLSDRTQSAELPQAADLALIRAKETGRTVGAYLPGDDSSYRHRLTILGELRQAIASNELELHYQPSTREPAVWSDARLWSVGVIPRKDISRLGTSSLMPSAPAPSVL